MGKKTRRTKPSRAVAPPPLGVPGPAQRAVDEFMEEARGLTIAGLLAKHREVVGEEPPPGAPRFLVETRIAYELQVRGFRFAGRELPERVAQNYAAAKAYDLTKFHSGMREVLATQLTQSEEGTMAKAKTTKATGRKPGSGARIRELLMKGLDPDAILEAIHAEFPQSKATRSDVNWNRRALRLDGQSPPAPPTGRKPREAAPPKGKKAAAPKGKKAAAPKGKKAAAPKGKKAAVPKGKKAEANGAAPKKRGRKRGAGRARVRLRLV